MPKQTLDKVYQKFIRRQVELGGGQYVGIQECEGWAHDLVLFNSPRSGSTLAVKSTVEDITVAVSKRLDAHDRKAKGDA